MITVTEFNVEHEMKVSIHPDSPFYGQQGDSKYGYVDLDYGCEQGWVRVQWDQYEDSYRIGNLGMFDLIKYNPKTYKNLTVQWK